MCATGSEAKALFDKACKDSLTLSEQTTLSQNFESDQRLVLNVGLTPGKVGSHTHCCPLFREHILSEPC